MAIDAKFEPIAPIAPESATGGPPECRSCALLLRAVVLSALLAAAYVAGSVGARTGAIIIIHRSAQSRDQAN